MSQRFADPKLRFHELAVRTLLPRRKPGTYLKPNLHLPANRPRITAYAPSILPIVRPKAGYAYFETRTVTTKHRRKWYPNYRPHTLPAQILGGQQTTQGNSMLLSPMRLRMEDVSEIEAAGGVEPFLVSRLFSQIPNDQNLQPRSPVSLTSPLRILLWFL